MLSIALRTAKRRTACQVVKCALSCIVLFANIIAVPTMIDGRPRPRIINWCRASPRTFVLGFAVGWSCKIARQDNVSLEASEHLV